MNELSIVAQEGALSQAQVTEQIKMIQAVMRQNMREGEHYGKIPGIGKDAKPTLLKSGAEKLALLFRLAPEYDIKASDLAKEGLGPPGHREVQVTCKLVQISTGRYYGSGVGSCSTLESKYRYRNDMVLGEDGKAVEVPGKYWQSRNPELLGGADWRPTKKDGKWVIVRKVEVTDIGDVYNTVLKMAKKRAYIDAILSATAASDIFTQDMEDLPPENEVDPGRDTRGHQGQANAPPERETITGVVSGVSSKQYKGQDYFFGEIKGCKLMTSDADLGADLQDAEGQEVLATCVRRAGKGPNDYKLLAIMATRAARSTSESETDAQTDGLNDDGSQGDNPY
jgi:hypothetical protein